MRHPRGAYGAPRHTRIPFPPTASKGRPRAASRLHGTSPLADQSFSTFKRQTRVVQNRLIDQFEVAVRRHGGDHAGNAMDDQTKTQFAGAYRVGRPFRSSMSIHVPYHWTTFPDSSRKGQTRKRNQRYVPSKRRRRPSRSRSPGEAKTDRQYSAFRSRSSG